VGGRLEIGGPRGDQRRKQRIKKGRGDRGAERRRGIKGKTRGKSRGKIRVKGRGESRLRRENSGESKADESTENGPRIDPDACMCVCMHACSPLHGLSAILV
jgi:hypothetical protein